MKKRHNRTPGPNLVHVDRHMPWFSCLRARSWVQESTIRADSYSSHDAEIVGSPLLEVVVLKIEVD